MAEARGTVRVDGLQTLRKRLRETNKDALKDVQRVIKSGSEIIAREGATLAPRKTGQLALSLKATTSGHKGVVRSRLPYANVIHWGGSTGRGHQPGRPWSGSVRVQGSYFLWRAMYRKKDAVTRELHQGFLKVARRNGWR